MSVVRNADGRLELFGTGDDGTLGHIYQKSPGGVWGQWSSLGGSLKFRPAAGRNALGGLEVFAVWGDGSLRHIWQTASSSGWSGWDNLGGGLLYGPLVFSNTDGTLDVFATTPDHALWHIKQSPSKTSWEPWNSLGGNVRSDGYSVGGNDLRYDDFPAIAVYSNLDGRLEVFAIFHDNTLRHIWQKWPGGDPHGTEPGWVTDWPSLGIPPGTEFLLGCPAVGRNADGRLEVFAFASDNNLWHMWQTGPNAYFAPWNSTKQVLLAGQPSIVRNADGRMEIFAPAEDGNLWHMWQTAPNASFTPWNSLGGAAENGWGDAIEAIGPVSVTSNADGRIEVFAGNVVHRWQTAPNNGWSDWGTVPPVDTSSIDPFAGNTPSSTWSEALGRAFIEF